jgi:hypothetical protein
LTASGTLPGPTWAKALSGIMVSAPVETAEPLEAVALPVLPIEFCAWLRAALEDAAAPEADDPADVAQRPLEGEVVIVAEAAAVGVEEVIGANVDDELGVDEEDVVAADVVAVESVAVGMVSDDGDVVPLVVVEPDKTRVLGALVAVVVVVVDDEEVEAVVADDAALVVVCAAATDPGEHAVVVAPAAGAPKTVPVLALVVCVPLAEPPEVLM